MEFQGKTLDQFQVDAAAAIDNGESVVVSAPTGSGKTLIAEYAIHKLFEGNQRAIYTAPIKALSNQKYRDFKATMGADRVGIITGDVVVNAEAQVLIMTTEIYRNILFQDPGSLHDVRCVVFDEVHYINDIERGTIWEESIIFSPEHIRFCFLSATIPNAREFAAWVESVHHHKVKTVEHHERPVPLTHLVYEHNLGLVPWERAYKFPVDNPKYFRTVPGRGGRKRRVYHKTSHLEVVEALKRQLPCLFFVFSRAGCEAMALEAAEHFDFTTPAEKEEIQRIADEQLKAHTEFEQLASVERLRAVLPRGIAV
ncbi:MAG TPA: DEAD/DEAH box helicase, partial [bacterium]|nr:DEAD/DEAH box helicase [bacterium]